MTRLRSTARPLLACLICLPLSACIIELDGDLAETIESHIDEHCIDDRHAHSEERTISETIEAVVIDSSVGDITVRTHAEAGAIVYADLFGDVTHGHHHEAHHDSPWLTVRGGVLYINAECPGGGCCGADLDLTIPATARVEIGLGVGDIELDGLSGSVDVDLGTGDLDLEHLQGPTSVHTSTGDIEGRDLTSSEVRADVGTGDVNLSYDDTADLQSLEVDVSVGEVELRVPDSAYTLDLDSGVGDVDVNGLESRADASRTIDVDVGTGSIDIRAR